MIDNHDQGYILKMELLNDFHCLFFFFFLISVLASIALWILEAPSLSSEMAWHFDLHASCPPVFSVENSPPISFADANRLF